MFARLVKVFVGNRKGGWILPTVMLLAVLVCGIPVAIAAIPVDELLNALQPKGYVSDFARVFSGQEEAALEQLLTELDRKTGAELAVVSITSLKGGEIDDFANRLFQKWGIGKKGKDNGVLLIAALEERKMRIEVGYGLEGLLPDARCGRIRDNFILPYFRREQYAAGLTAGAQAIAARISSEAGVSLSGAVALRRPAKHSPMAGLLRLVFMVFLVIFCIRHPFLALLLLSGGRGGGGGFGGGGFGGFGGGLSGGGGASGGW